MDAKDQWKLIRADRKHKQQQLDKEQQQQKQQKPRPVSSKRPSSALAVCIILSGFLLVLVPLLFHCVGIGFLKRKMS